MSRVQSGKGDDSVCLSLACGVQVTGITGFEYVSRWWKERERGRLVRLTLAKNCSKNKLDGPVSTPSGPVKTFFPSDGYWL